MTKKPKYGTLSTIGPADKQGKASKEADVLGKMKFLLGLNKIRISVHANARMGERGIIYFEVLQALSSGRHNPKRDRFSYEFQSWEYSFEGMTRDDRKLRIGISFEKVEKRNEILVVITVIDLKEE